MALQYREIFRKFRDSWSGRSLWWICTEIGAAVSFEGFRGVVLRFASFWCTRCVATNRGKSYRVGEDGLCHYCKPCFVNAKPLIPSNRIVLPFPEEIIISFQELINEIIPNSIPSLSSKVFAMIQLIFLINFTFMEKIIHFVPEFNYK